MLTRTSSMNWSSPWKCLRSVSTEMPAAPPIVYVRATARCASTATSRPLAGGAGLSHRSFLCSGVHLEQLAEPAEGAPVELAIEHEEPRLREQVHRALQ